MTGDFLFSFAIRHLFATPMKLNIFVHFLFIPPLSDITDFSTIYFIRSQVCTGKGDIK